MTIDLENIPVKHNEAAHRFEACIKGKPARIDYYRKGMKIVFTHTIVPEAYEGQGLGARLIQTALDYARDEQLVVVPICPFVVDFIRDHPEYRDLVLPGVWL